MIFLRRREIVRHPAGNHHKGCLLGIQENPDIDIGKRKSSSKVVNLLRRMDRYKENLLKFLFTTDVPFDNNLAKESTEDVQR